MLRATLPSVLDLVFSQAGPGGIGWTVPTEDIEVDAARPICQVEPISLVTTAAWANRIWREGRRIIIRDSVKSALAWSTGLLSALADKTPFCTEVTHAGNWFPLCRATGAHEIEEFSSKVGALLKVPRGDARSALEYTINEMVRNAEEHGESKGPAFFTGTFFPKTGRIVFAVADTGIGIRASLNRRGLILPSDGDADALEKALQPFVTGAGDPDEPGAPGNAGLGLPMTRRIVAACRGEIVLQSARARFLEMPGESNFLVTTTPWHGTSVQVTIRPSQMPAFDPLFTAITASDVDSGIQLNFKNAPREALTLVPHTDDSGFAASKSWFAEHRPEVMSELEGGGTVAVDFKDARYTTQGAVHALFYEPLRTLGPDALTRIWFLGAGSQIRSILKQVVAYALEHHRETTAKSTTA